MSKPSKHWLYQRISAVVLLFLLPWGIYQFVVISAMPKETLALFFAPLNHVIFAILLIVAALYHGALGMQIIFEDYISCKVGRSVMIWLTSLTAAITAFITIVTIIRIHIIISIILLINN